MKKFASLLAIVAVFAMSATAFAAGIAASGGIAEYEGSEEISNTFTAGSTNADATGKVYYYGTTVPELLIGVKLKADTDYTSTSGKYTATIDPNAAIDGGESVVASDSAEDESFTIPAGQIAATGTTPVVFKVEDGSGAKDDTATLTLTPTPVTFTATYNSNADATKGVMIKTANTTSVEIHLEGVNGTDKVDFTNLSVVSKDTSDVTIATNTQFLGVTDNGVTATYEESAATLTLTVASDGGLKAGLKGTLTLVGTGSAPTLDSSTVVVAGIDDQTVILEIPVETVDYEVKPQTATWAIGTSDDVVSLDVDMKYADFGCVSTDLAGFELLVTSADKVGTDSYVSKDIVISADTTHMVISLDKTLLSNMAGAIRASQGDYADINEPVKVNVVDKDGKFASMTITFTRSADQRPQPPQDGTPTNVPASSNPNLPATSNDVASAQTIADYVETQGFSVDTSGQITNGVAVVSDNRIPVWGTVNASTLVPLPVVSAEVRPNAVATIAFANIDGTSLVSGDATGSGVRVVNVADLNVIKAVSADKAAKLTAATTAQYEKGTADELNGKYVILWTNGSATTKVDRVSSASSDFTLYVFVADEGDYDLAKGAGLVGKVVDPILLVKSTGASHSSSSSCDMGFGAAALAGLAVLALRKRSK